MSSVSGLASAGGVLLIVGLVLILIGAVVAWLLRGRALRPSVGIVGVGAVIVVIGLVAGAFAPATNSSAPPAPPQATVVAQLASAPALLTGETWNSITNTLTVDVVYNKTGNVWMVQAVLTGVASHPNWINLPVKLVRTDSINATFSFPVTVASIPTFSSLGSSPTTYSFVGYKTATSTTPGVWQLSWTAGVLSGQNPVVSAPSVATNVLTNGCPVNAFNSLSPILKVSLAGGNSTSMPTLAAEAVQNFTAYPMVVTFGNAAPTQFVVNFVPIGWSA